MSGDLPDRIPHPPYCRSVVQIIGQTGALPALFPFARRLPTARALVPAVRAVVPFLGGARGGSGSIGLGGGNACGDGRRV